MVKQKDILKLEVKIVPILKKGRVTKAGIFGSFARGEQKKDSDIDILVQVDDSLGYFGLVSLKKELEKKLNRNVDLVEYDWIHPRIKKRALREEIRII